jgi:hypothetical protein
MLACFWAWKFHCLANTNREALIMFNKIINDEANRAGAGGGDPLSWLWLGLASLFSSFFLFGCSNILAPDEMTNDLEEVPAPPSDYNDQLIPYGNNKNITVKLIAGSNDAVDVTVRSSKRENWKDTPEEKEQSGLKILLDEYYKNSPGAEEIELTFEALPGDKKKFDFQRLIVTLLDNKTKNYEYLGDTNRPTEEYKEYMRSAIFVPLYRMDLSADYAEPHAWDNPQTYGVSVDLARQSVKINLSQREVLIHNLQHRDPTDRSTNITISEVQDRSVKFSVRDTANQPSHKQWSYLGVDLTQQFGKAGQAISATGGLSLGLKGLPAGSKYRVVLQNSDKAELIFYPEEHPEIASGGLLKLEYFHEDFYAAELGAQAGLTEQGALRLKFNGLDSRVTVTDKSATKAAVNLRQNYDGQKNGYLALRIAADAAFNYREFLSKVRPTLSCVDASGTEEYYALDKQLGFDPAGPDKLAKFAVYDAAHGYWNIRIPLSHVSAAKSLPNAELTIAGVSLAAAEKDFKGEYNILEIGVFADGAAQGHVVPFPAVDRSKPFVSAGVSLRSASGAALPDLELKDFALHTSAAEKTELNYLRRDKSLVSKGAALSLVFYTGVYTDEDETDFRPDPEGVETAYRVRADHNIVNVAWPPDELAGQEGE